MQCRKKHIDQEDPNSHLRSRLLVVTYGGPVHLLQPPEATPYALAPVLLCTISNSRSTSTVIRSMDTAVIGGRSAASALFWYVDDSAACQKS